MDRRSFLVVSSLACGSLLVGCASPARQNLRSTDLPLGDREIALNGWLKVAADGVVTVVMSKSEMGQGVHTALMMLVAEEMDCPLSQTRFEYAPIDPLYGNVAALSEAVPFRPDDDGVVASTTRWVARAAVRQLGFMMTGGSSSLRDLWLPMRHAAAATRATLVDVAARQWRVQPGEVQVLDGVFTGPNGLKASLGEVVQWAGPQPVPAERVQLKNPDQFRMLGKPTMRLESRAKVDGSAAFGIDVRQPGLLFAAVRMSPVRAGKLKSFNASAVLGKPGIAGVVPFEGGREASGGVAVVADGWWKAKKALAQLDAQFDDGPMAGFSTSQLQAILRKTLDTDNGFGFWKKGDPKDVIRNSNRVLNAEYFAPYLAHATMEPMNCTVQFTGASARIWVPSQVPGFARKAAAKALGLSESKVELTLTYLGGGFGRRLETDFITQAAQIARQFPGKTIQVLWSREDDMRHDFYRPACLSRFTAALDDKGRIQAWVNTSAGQAITPGYLPRNAGLPVFGPDKTASEGAFDAAYEFPNTRVGHATVDLPVPVGYWRAVGHSHHAFFKECFLDECAAEAGADPLDYRRDLLVNNPRHRAVLELAASKAAWSKPLGRASDGAAMARGIAIHECFGSVVAQVAEVSVSSSGEIRVHRVVCAIDCGFAVNPNTIAQQVESSVVYGLTAALYGKIDIKNGEVQQGNFNDYMPLRFDECPVIETHIVPSAEAPQGVGEPALPPLAPAVANAVFAATGKRLRSLPLNLSA